MGHTRANSAELAFEQGLCLCSSGPGSVGRCRYHFHYSGRILWLREVKQLVQSHTAWKQQNQDSTFSWHRPMLLTTVLDCGQIDQPLWRQGTNAKKKTKEGIFTPWYSWKIDNLTTIEIHSSWPGAVAQRL